MTWQGRTVFALLYSTVFVALVASQGTNLGGGITTRIAVGEYADLSLDLRDIRAFVDANNMNSALGMYLQGSHAEFVAGQRTPLKITTDAVSSAERTTPWYLFHLYGLASLSTDPMELEQHKSYAGNYIQKVFTTNLEVAESAILALGLWMYATHLLFDGVAICEMRTRADNPALFNLAGGGMDEFIALWIGSDQTVATANGHGLYAWAHTIGERFGTASPEAVVNVRLKALYQEGSGTLTVSLACTSANQNSVALLHTTAVQMTNLMVIPLYQWLIYSLIEQDAAAVKLYATALIPQLSKCRPSTFKRLKSSLLNDSINFDKTNATIRDLQSSYYCFDITCEDIGIFNGDNRLQCIRKDEDRRIAGFLPSKSTEPLHRMDLDVKQLKMLTAVQGTLFAQLLYSHGSNVPKARHSENDPFTYHSLSELATTTARQDADPIFSDYTSYHGDKDYAHKYITSVLSGLSKWTTPQQNGEAVGLTSAYHILFVTAVGRMNAAIKSCHGAAADPNATVGETYQWDEAAMLIIGSMEGPILGGSPDLGDGEFTYGLANRHAFQFNTRNDLGYSKVISDIENLLFAGKGELDAGDCDNFERTANKLQKILFVPVIQSSIASASESHSLSPSSTSLSLTRGEIFSMSVIPIIHTEDPLIAEVLAENMIWKDTIQPVRDGPQIVADAFGEALQNTIGLSCLNLRSTGEINPCRKVPGIGSAAVVEQFAWPAAVSVSVSMLLIR
jgi:hypothetical protein